ncbi:stalk domain-containing protein [Marinicrinis sediminis]|uniref:Stalk domain-containing protein n=1 Tax=Marinicrinis sediminis TaxID=1652465 RepID=A0ABW5R8Z8_9BACL
MKVHLSTRYTWMNKWMVLVLILAIGLTTPVSDILAANKATANEKPVPAHMTVLLNDEILQFDVQPVIVKGSTLVPLRKIFESLDASVYWKNDTKTVTATKGQMTFTYTIGDMHAWRNDWKLPVATIPGMIVEGNTMVPLRFVSESLGVQVHYVAETRTIHMVKPEKTWSDAELTAELDRYRLPLPYKTILNQAPEWIAYMQSRVNADSVLFFGDSTTWGSYLGSKETLPYLAGQELGTSAYNLGVPGFSPTQMMPFIDHVLTALDEQKPAVVIQLQYFWDQPTTYTGFTDMLQRTIPPIEDARQALTRTLPADEEKVEPAYADYAQQSAEKKSAMVARGKQIFVKKHQLSSEMNSRLQSLRALIQARPQQQFYVYLPPYLMGEVTTHTELKTSDVQQYVNLIERQFEGLPNVYVRNFNDGNEEWTATDFIDWLHRSKQGEKRFAAVLTDWIQQEQAN